MTEDRIDEEHEHSEQHNEGPEEGNIDSESDDEYSTRGETSWPVDCLTVEEVDKNGYPKDEETCKRFKRVCGLTGRQKVNINLNSFRDLKEAQRKQLFALNIQKYVAFPQHLRKAATKLSMNIISKAWRNHKYRLGEMWREGRDPFQIYKELNQDDWNRFIAKLNTEEAKKLSKKMSDLRSLNEDDHHLGPAGYKGKKKIWDEEDEELARAGVDNVWKKFPGRSENYVRGRAVLNRETGSIMFLSSEVSEVAQKVLSAASDGTVTGSRENDLLSQALGKPEQRGRVRGVGSYVGWKAGFPNDADSFRKRKKRSDDIDYEEVTRHVLSALRPALSGQGIDIPEDLVINIPRAPTTNPKSSHASVDCEAGQNDQGCSTVRDEAQDPSDSINLDRPTRCRLMISFGPMTLEAARGFVYPQDMFINEDVPVRDGFFAVRIETVHENMMDAELEVPLDDIKTLRHAQHSKVQWRRSLIITESTSSLSAATPSPQIAPIAPSPSPPPPPQKSPPAATPFAPQNSTHAAASLPARPQDRPATAVPQDSPAISIPQDRPATSVPQKFPPNPPKLPVRKPSVKKSANKKKKKEAMKASNQDKGKFQKQEAMKTSMQDKGKYQVPSCYVQDNPAYKPGEPMMTQDELKAAGESVGKLHDYYMSMYKAGKISIIVQYMKKHFLCESSYFLVSWGDLYDLFNFAELDTSIMRCWALHIMQKNPSKGKDGVGILDPGVLSRGTLNFSRKEAVDGVIRAMSRFSDGEVLCTYNPGRHWILLVLSMKRNEVFYLDSLNYDFTPAIQDFSEVRGIIDEAFDTYLKQLKKNNKNLDTSHQKLVHHTNYKCPQQPNHVECGWYVAANIAYVTTHPNIHDYEMSFDPLPYSNLIDIREAICKFILEEVISEKGEFCYNPGRRG